MNVKKVLKIVFYCWLAIIGVSVVIRIIIGPEKKAPTAATATQIVKDTISPALALRNKAIRDSISLDSARLVSLMPPPDNDSFWEVPKVNWNYSTDEDEMTSRKIYSASVAADQTVYIRSEVEPTSTTITTTSKSRTTTKIPRTNYNDHRDGLWGTRNAKSETQTTTTQTFSTSGGGGNATIYLELTKSGGKSNVSLYMSGGDFSSEYATGRAGVRIRFDKLQPVYYSVTGAASRELNTFFFQNPAGLINNLKKARRIKVEVNVAGNGTHILDFDVHGLKW